MRRTLARLERLVDWERLSRVPNDHRAVRRNSKPCGDLLRRLGEPQRGFRSVHVTGSKGKGTTAAMVAAGIREAGYKTGTYASPHVEKVNERVRVDGIPVEDEVLADALDKALDARETAIRDGTEGRQATWFDVVTSAGMLCLKNARVDWATVEVGLGGRLDSTNVLNAPVVAITNIALEHAQIIGPTLSDIAREKSGIVSPGAIVLAGVPPESDVGKVISEESCKLGAASIQFVVPEKRASLADRNLNFARSILDSMTQLDPLISGRNLSERVAQQTAAYLPGRAETFYVRYPGSSKASDPQRGSINAVSDVMIILDGAHVPSSVSLVLRQVASKLECPPVFILALRKEKDVVGMLAALGEHPHESLILTQVGSESQFLPSLELYREARKLDSLRDCRRVRDPQEALKVAIEIATDSVDSQHLQRPMPAVVVVGSLYLVGKLRPILRKWVSAASKAENDN